jgi:glycosyltransferase involved in cell wall biosynthesis
VFAQTYSHVEVVVIDDGSTDNTHQVAARYPGVNYISQPNKGFSAARNEGLRSSAGAFVVFLDADDTMEPEGLARGVECLEAHPEAAFAYGRFRRTDADGIILPDEPHAPLGTNALENLLRGNHIGMHATVMYRRAVLRLVDGLDERLEGCEDYDLYLRVARRMPVASHHHFVARYRRHAASTSADLPRMLRSALQVLERQYPYVQGDRSLLAAYLEGQQNWKKYYGRQILSKLQRDVRHRTIGASTLRNLWTVARFAPGELLSAIRRGVLSAKTPANNEIVSKAEFAAVSYTSVAERVELCNLARNVKADGLIVEIGGLYGGMTAVLGLANPRARLVVVDDFSWSPIEGEPADADILLSNCQRVGVSNVKVIPGNSRDIGETWKDPIELLWVDGGHDYESVRSDLATFGPHARRIALHDWDNPAWPGIRLAVEEFVKASLGWRVSHSVEMVVVLERGS